jgi:CBS domain-containing protein
MVLGPDDDLAQASRLVRDHAVRRIPVLRDGTPVGVVAVGDLALESGATSVLSGMSSPPNDRAGDRA